uniref:Radical SAM domain protein n=1 Tax=uncultured bacterium contig00054 TaxID=1181538 RepID=A0A806K1P1_9BACT|nr:radical SAM domain protein [uncultured bacterium contig00054]
MALNANPVENHRGRESGLIVYPVYSRRSGGLSIGINLFPDKKECPFDCPYCEVFPFSSNAAFSLPRMEEDLCEAIIAAGEQNVVVKDICFSGNGEPSLSLDFPDALELAAKVRGKLAPSASIVFITNGTGLLTPEVFKILRDAAVGETALDIWLKLDAGTPEWYEKINRCDIEHEYITAIVKRFTSCAPATIQTMLCAIDGKAPPPEEAQAWEKLLLELAEEGNVRKVQLYGKARPAPEDPLSSALPVSYLEDRATSLRSALTAKGFSVPVEVYP